MNANSTSMNVFLSGGHWQGIRIGCPLAPTYHMSIPDRITVLDKCVLTVNPIAIAVLQKVKPVLYRRE